MNKRLFVFLTVLLTCALLAGCGVKPLPEGFDADEVTARAEQIVSFANEGEYDEIIASLRDDLQDAVTAEQLETGWDPIYEKVGAFSELKQVALTATEDSSTGEEYAVALVTCAHEDGNVLYTLSFDTELELVGLYLK
jgi:predicted small lipoprotein YifL